MLDILQEEYEIGGVTIGKERVCWLVAISVGIEIVPLESVHRLEHANQQFVETAFVSVRTSR
jgi:hypothetical protein